MDPGFVLETLTMAMMVPVPLPGRITTLIDATDEDLDEMRSDKGRSGAIAIAKKALKIAELTKELRSQMGLAGIKQPQPPGKKNGRSAAQTAATDYAAPVNDSGANFAGGKAQEGVLALIPLLNTVNPDKRKQKITFSGPRFELGLPGLPDAWAFHGRVLFIFLRFFVVWFPVLAAYACVFYVLSIVGFMASNPRLLVKGFFAVMDAAPVYFSFVVEQMFDELRSQMTARIIR
jgi:hypothetical protein